MNSKAIKIIKTSRLSIKEHEMAKKEAALLYKFSHPNLIKCEDFFEESFNESNCLMLIFEYCPVSGQVIAGEFFENEISTIKLQWSYHVWSSMFRWNFLRKGSENLRESMGSCVKSNFNTQDL